MRKPSPYNQIISLLQELHRTFPEHNMGRHISTALDGYGDVWGTTDKELLFAFQKYQLQLESDTTPQKTLDVIIKEGMNLDDIFKDEENGEDY